MSLVGESFSAWRAWDGIRGLDYLLSRPEVDGSRVGVTGNSGGGTLSSYVNALDDRITMCAASCYVTTLLSNLENELPADSEQYPVGMLAAGLDIGDFFLAQAPRATLVMGQKFDYFDIRGLQKTFEQIRHVYQLLGTSDNIKLFIGPSSHGYSSENRHAMYEFFGDQVGSASHASEEESHLETDTELQVTSNGMVIELEGNRRIFEFTAERARLLGDGRRRLEAAALREAARDVLNLPPRAGAPHYRVFRDRSDDYTGEYQNVQLYGVETEPAHPSLMAILQAWNKVDPLNGQASGGLVPCIEDAVLYVPHVSSRGDVLRGQLPMKVDSTIFAVDPRGMGMSQPLTSNDTNFFSIYGADYMHAGHGSMLIESYCGRRVHDVLSVLDLLAECGTRRVHLVGRGIGAVLAAFAALLHPLVQEVTLKNAPVSFTHLAQLRLNAWPLSSLPRGILQSFDLPDVFELLRAKRLKMIDSWQELIEREQI
jgi:hypothetical protein